MGSSLRGSKSSGKEYFLDHRDYPWFQRATVSAIWNVVLGPGGDLHWPDLDVDLEIDSLDQPSQYPLIDWSL